jgi:excisionase family DNA binding protein
MSKSYSVTREVAAKSLNVSTRTIDRYIKSGKLSYKKIANKVLLAKEEILKLKEDFTTLHQELTTEIVSQDN